LRIVTLGISGGRSLTRPFRGVPRFPSTGWDPVPRTTRTPRKLGRCPSFKGPFLSPRAQLLRYDSQRFLSAARRAFGQVRCSVRYRYRQGSWPHIQGEGRASALVGDSGVDLLVRTAIDAAGIPVAAASDPADCAARIVIQSIAVSEAGLQGWLVKLLRGVIKSSISKSLSDQTCQFLQPLVATNGSALLATAADGIRRVEALPPPRSGAPYPPPPSLVDLAASPAVHVARYMLDTLLAPGGPWSVDRAAPLLLPLGYWLSPPLLAYHWLLPSSLFNVTVQLTAATVAGLETATVTHVETPSAHRLDARVAFRELRLNLFAKVRFVPGPAVQHSKGAVDLNLTLSATLADVAGAFRIVSNCFELFRIVSNCFEMFRIVLNSDSRGEPRAARRRGAHAARGRAGVLELGAEPGASWGFLELRKRVTGRWFLDNDWGH
jgi:hypothetical protein